MNLLINLTGIIVGIVVFFVVFMNFEAAAISALTPQTQMECVLEQHEIAAKTCKDNNCIDLVILKNCF